MKKAPRVPLKIIGLIAIGCTLALFSCPSAPKSPETTAAPTFDPPGGIYNKPIAVSIYSSTEGAEIRYTLDGSDPSETFGTIFTGPIQVAEGTAQIMAIACRADMTSSAVVSMRVAICTTMPELPWPPPTPTTRDVVRIDELNTGERASGRLASLAAIASLFENALGENGYSDCSYYYIPGGFALVTRVERMNADGTSSRENRWSDSYSITWPPNDLFSWLFTIFVPQSNLYRMFIIFVAPEYFRPSATPATYEDSKALSGGRDPIPSAFRQVEVLDSSVCSIYVYEFEQSESTHRISIRTQPLLQARDHLKASGIFRNLVK